MIEEIFKLQMCHVNKVNKTIIIAVQISLENIEVHTQGIFTGALQEQSEIT